MCWGICIWFKKFAAGLSKEQKKVQNKEVTMGTTDLLTEASGKSSSKPKSNFCLLGLSSCTHMYEHTLPPQQMDRLQQLMTSPWCVYDACVSERYLLLFYILISPGFWLVGHQLMSIPSRPYSARQVNIEKTSAIFSC